MYFDYLIWFPLIWVLSFVFHEFMHCFEHMRQGGNSWKIQYWSWKGLPSMRVYLSGVQLNPASVHLAGGLYTSFFHLVVMCIYLLLFGFQQNGFVFSVCCIGLVQLFYGYYEMLYINMDDRNQYMLGHYILYGLVISVFCVVWLLL